MKQHGSTHSNAKLTEADVREMRRLYFEEGWSYARIARKWVIHTSHIRSIVRGYSWKHTLEREEG